MPSDALRGPLTVPEERARGQGQTPNRTRQIAAERKDPMARKTRTEQRRESRRYKGLGWERPARIPHINDPEPEPEPNEAERTRRRMRGGRSMYEGADARV